MGFRLWHGAHQVALYWQILTKRGLISTVCIPRYLLKFPLPETAWCVITTTTSNSSLSVNRHEAWLCGIQECDRWLSALCSGVFSKWKLFSSFLFVHFGTYVLKRQLNDSFLCVELSNAWPKLCRSTKPRQEVGWNLGWRFEPCELKVQGPVPAGWGMGFRPSSSFVPKALAMSVNPHITTSYHQFTSSTHITTITTPYHQITWTPHITTSFHWLIPPPQMVKSHNHLISSPYITTSHHRVSSPRTIASYPHLVNISIYLKDSVANQSRV